MIEIDKDMKIHIALAKEDGYWVARCAELMITDKGISKEDAIKNLKRTIIDISKEYGLKRIPYQEKMFEDWEIIQDEIDLEVG